MSPSFTPVSLPAPALPPAGAYSPAVIAGDLIFVSGQIPKRLDTGEMAGPSIEEQTRQVFTNLRMALEAAGASLADLVSVTVYLTDTDHWGEFDRIYRELFTPPYPTRAVVGAQLRGILIEVSGIARRPDR